MPSASKMCPRLTYAEHLTWRHCCGLASVQDIGTGMDTRKDNVNDGMNDDIDMDMLISAAAAVTQTTHSCCCHTAVTQLSQSCHTDDTMR